MWRTRQSIVPIGMVIVLLWATFLYTVHLNAISFWEDESWLSIGIDDSLSDLWTFSTERGVHPPLFYYMAWFYARLVGDGELVLRWLSAMMALVGLAVTYRLGSRLFDRQVGLYASVLLSGSIYLIYMARIARQYSLFFTLSVVVMWAYVHWRDKPTSGWRLFWVVLAQIALMYTHYFGAWVGFAIVLHAIWFDRRFAMRLMGGLALGALSYVPWLPSVIYQFTNNSSGLTYAIHDPWVALSNYSDRIFNATHLLGITLVILGVIALIRGRKRWQGVLLFLWVVAPFVPILGLNERFAWFIGRNMLFTLGGVVLVYGVGLAMIARHRMGHKVALFAIGVFVGIGVIIYPNFFEETANWRRTMAMIAPYANVDDIYVLNGEPYSADYYMRRLMGERLNWYRMQDWWQDPVTDGRIWLIDAQMAVRFEAIDAIPSQMVQTRRIVDLPIVAELYEVPPRKIVAVFGDVLHLGIDRTGLPEALEADSALQIRLWWQAQQPLSHDYSVGLFLIMEGAPTLAESHGGFDEGRVSSLAMPVGEWITDTRSLMLPQDLPAGIYGLWVRVYDWQTGDILTSPTAGDYGLVLLGTLEYGG